MCDLKLNERGLLPSEFLVSPSQRNESVTSDKQHLSRSSLDQQQGKCLCRELPLYSLQMQLEGSRVSENLLLIGDETRFMRELTYCLQNLDTQLARGNVLYFPELWCNSENNTKCFVCLGSDF